MKIFYISGSVIPSRTANSIHVMKMCSAFAQNNHDVTLLSGNKKQEMLNNIEDIFSYYGVENNFRVKKVWWPTFKGGGYFYSFLAALLSRYFSPDIVFSRNLAGAYFSLLFGLRVILEVHSPIEETGFLSRLLFNKIIVKKKFIKLILITYSLKEHYLNKYPNLINKIQVAPDGADLISYDVCPIDLPNKNRLQVGYVGHLYQGKGMEIISKLAPLCDWADFHVVGGTQQDIDLWKNKCSGIKNLNFHGFIPHRETVKYIKAFNVLLLPNQRFVGTSGTKGENISAWTSPLKAFEYMSAAKPILCSDLPVLREVFEDGRNALLCDPDDPVAWSEALLKLKTHPELVQHLAEQAYVDLKLKYSWFVRASKVIENSN